VAVTNGQDERNFDPGIKLVLTELRDLRIEMRADRQQANAERRQADAERRQERLQADEERRKADEARRQERLRSDARFEEMMREFRRDSARHAALTQKAFKNIHTVGLAIVKTLNRHTRILEHHGHVLERIDRKLDPRWNGRPGRGNGRTE
jgi:hypothetical protein